MLAACAAMMAAFLGYHLWLVRVGMTTNETYKWRDLRLALGEQLAGNKGGGSEDGRRHVQCAVSSRTPLSCAGSHSILMRLPTRCSFH